MVPLIRIFYYAPLLWVIWHHAHWSVALFLTLIYVSQEAGAFASRATSVRLDALSTRLKAARQQQKEEDHA